MTTNEKREKMCYLLQRSMFKLNADPEDILCLGDFDGDPIEISTKALYEDALEAMKSYNSLPERVNFPRELAVCQRFYEKSISKKRVYASNWPPKIKKVRFSDPATIVIWEDNTKTIVRCKEGETYDPEKGLAMCFSKKLFGNCGAYYNTFKEYLPAVKQEDSPIEQKIQKVMVRCPKCPILPTMLINKFNGYPDGYYGCPVCKEVWFLSEDGKLVRPTEVKINMLCSPEEITVINSDINKPKRDKRGRFVKGSDCDA